MLAPAVLYPAPGLPHFAASDRNTLELIVRTADRDADVGAWAAALHLTPAIGTAPVETSLESIEALDPSRPPVEVGTALALGDSPTTRLLRLRLTLARVAPPADARRFHTYSLRHRETVLRHNCVAIDAGAPGDRLALAFASDLHVAAIWDAIDATFERHGPELRRKFLHPNRLLRRFVREVNHLATRGELDLVILGGDLVDHVRPDEHVRTKGSNVDHFLELLRELTVPCCVIPGNHDFRLHPWRPRIYPYASVGLPRARVAAALRKAGLWDAWPLRRGDLRALETRDEEGRCALSEHLWKLAPAVDYRIDLPENEPHAALDRPRRFDALADSGALALEHSGTRLAEFVGTPGFGGARAGTDRDGGGRARRDQRIGDLLSCAAAASGTGRSGRIEARTTRPWRS